ncbi:RE1 [Symbiodinium sp. CCMP2592]|nr:RE1 [Symbiodinium sp. CCMP2592]
MVDQKTDTLLLGVYAHGNHYGVTNWTRKLPQSCKYLWSYLKKWTPEAIHGSTLVINKNCKHGMHRDVHNQPGTKNYSIGVSQYKQGEVWLEGPGPSPTYKTIMRQTPTGQQLPGHLRSVNQQVVSFDAHKWHATQDWSGKRWIVTEKKEGEEQAMVGEKGGGKPSKAQEEESIKKKLYLLHAATGHGSVRHMIDALKRRKASPLVIRLAQEFKCSICQEKARVQPRQTASLEPIPPKFHTITADIGHWVHPASGEHQNFMVVVDEGSRFRMAKILLKGQKQAPTSAACINYLQEGWFQVFGRPKTLRLDPAGSFRSSTVESFCDRHSIYHDVIPGEAHWQIGLAEQAVQGLKLLMSKICETDPTTTPEEAISMAVSVFNQREVVRGYSPVQHVLGQAPDAMGRFLPHEGNLPEEVPASDREELLEALGPEQTAPWTFSRVAEEVGGNSYQDLTQETPSEQEWMRAQEWEDVDGGEPSQPSVVRRTSAYVGPKLPEPECANWWDKVAESAWSAEASAYWTEEQQAVEIEIPLPESRRGQEHMCKNMQGFFVSALKRRAIEVCERKLSEGDREKFREAKNAEVRNFISAKAFEALPRHLQPDRSQAVGMRWILTWKVKDDGGVKAKARAVLLGYQDPQYEFRSTAAPVMTRQTRQLFLQLSANNRWAIQKGDITGAFLQGREYPDDLFCIPCPEICSSMGIPEGSITKLKRACYGLVDAPLEWYKTIAEYLESIGLTRLWSDSCAWVWRPGGPGTAVRGMITGHVDDFLFGGSSEDSEWQAILEKIRTRFKWGDWDSNNFVQCGVEVRTVPEGFELSQPKYLATVEEIPLNTTRRKDPKAATTPQEKSQLRALLGALSWYAQQTAPHLSADVSLMLSEVGQSTVNTIVRANQLLSVERNRKGHKLLIQRCDNEDMQLFAWVDAASQNRLDGSSTQGIFVGAASKKLFQGEIAAVSPISWHSTRIERKCRSPGAAETQAAVNGEDALFYARFQWSEILHGQPNLREPSETVRQTDGCLITDSRNVYDKLQTEMLVIKGAEKRSNIELLSLKEAQQSSNLVIRWVHSEAQLANSLTKCGGNQEMDLYYRMNFAWRIVEDSEMMSARRRKSKGLQPLQQHTQQEVISCVFEKEHF